MDEETNEEIVDKNQYHLDDDDFLSAPGGLYKNRQSKHDEDRDHVTKSNHNEEETKHTEAKKKPIMIFERRNSIPYQQSDDTSDTSDDDGPIHRKYTTQSTLDSLNPITSISANANVSGKQYTILLNDKSFLHDPNAHSFPSNYIKTSKYTLLTFIPLNLFEQFRRIANIYFLMIIGVQLIPGVSPFPIETSIMPLAFILIVGAIKDGIEDYDRHKSDRIANSRRVFKLDLSSGEFSATTSALLEPSDIISVQRNEVVPADCIVLGTLDASNNNNNGVCYINTSSMDGENAPKLRRALESTHNILDSRDLCKLRGSLKCPLNNKSLHGFTGCLSIKKSSIPKNVKMSSNAATATKDNKRNSKRLTLSERKLKTSYETVEYDESDDDDSDVDNSDEKGDDDDEDYLSAKIVDKVVEKKAKKVNDNNDDKMSGLSDINFVFRGSKLVNTQSMIALVLFVGRETKLMLNRNEVPFKFSKFESILNRMILSILIFNFILCVVFAILANIVPEPFVELRRTSWSHGFILDFCSWLILTSWMIPFSLYVTLELVKMIQAQWVSWDDNMTYDVRKNGADSAWDAEYGKIRRAKTKNSNLNEELGHIDYLFTDKTGTLTQNQMELSKCSVGGHKYRITTNKINAATSAADSAEDFQTFSSLISNMIRYYEKKRSYSGGAAAAKKEEKDDDDEEEEKKKLSQLERDTHFVLNLLLCSSTLPLNKNNMPNNSKLYLENQARVASDSDNIDSNNKKEKQLDIEFQSPSPDEIAFAEALCDFGVILSERQADGTLIIRLRRYNNDSDIIIKFRVLATLDFTAQRKRMTVIVLDEFGSIHLYSKGADTILYKLCAPQQQQDGDKKQAAHKKAVDKKADKIQHITRRHLTSFARDGSRTMVQAYRSLTMTEYDEFDRYYREAEVALGPNRSSLIESAFNFLEHSLILLGCTAVEDQIQDGVASAIAKLKLAQIKVIMLTGDKQETAVSIGRQSQIISPSTISSESQLLFLSARCPTNPKDFDALEKQQRKVDKKLCKFLADIECEQEKEEENVNNIEYALILNGDALEMCLNRMIIATFLSLFARCSTIICNRCNPSQKALLVLAVKNHNINNGVTCAIGDGANDVSMIQCSNVGIGIMGKEGTQASLAADFVLHRFKHIVRLLFVHGRYSFLRTAQVSLLSLYKNMAFMLTICYYGAYSLYTAQSCFDPYLMSAFNLMFAAAFPLCAGAFEQDINQSSAINHPTAYFYFKRNSFFTMKYFLFWMFTAFWQSAAWFIVAIIVYYDNFDIWNDKNGGLYVFGTQIFTTNVVVICCKMMMETYHWNWTYFVATASSILIYIVTAAILSNWLYFDSDMFYVLQFTTNSNINWLLLQIQCVLCLFPGILYHLWKRERSASLSNILYEANKFGYITKNGVHRPTDDVVKDYLSR